LVEVFDASAARWPTRRAIADHTSVYSYSETAQMSVAVAARLQESGIRPNDRVGVCMRRGALLAVAILGVLRAGSSYVPLDPDYPRERRDYIASDAQLAAVIRDGESPPLAAEDVPHIVLEARRLQDLARAPSSGAATSAKTAYVIYTSGSTGRPNGVLVPHSAVLALLEAALPLFKFTSDDRWSLFHSVSFDFSVWELWGAWATGACAVVVPSATASSARMFLDFLVGEQITVVCQVPSYFRHVARLGKQRPESFEAVRYIMFGGESIDLQSVHDVAAATGDGLSFVNMYGITETTVHATAKILPAAPGTRTSPSPIGRSLPHLSIDIVDESGVTVSEGERGEMWISGESLATGYLNRPELTAERFVVRDLGAGPRRYFRSGDVAWRDSDGELHYVGRQDDQVKLHGYRIELGEIEAAARAYPETTEAIALLQRSPSGDSFLVLAVSFAGTSATDHIDGLREHLLATLPRHMVPFRYAALDALPVTDSGKLDRISTQRRIEASPLATGPDR